MKPLPFKVPKNTKESFRVQEDSGKHLYDTLHQHKEWQVMSIEEGEGTVIVGDYLGEFKVGDLFVIGENMPHVFRNDSRYYEEESELKAKAVSVYFDKDSFGKEFFQLPEMYGLLELMRRSSRGIRILNEDIKVSVSKKLKELYLMNGMMKTITLLDILHQLTECTEIEYLASSNNLSFENEVESKRMDKIFKFTIEEYHRPISLQEIADKSNMTPNAFCRYFKKRTQKTYVTFLNEVRIGQACKILLEENRTVTEVCYHVGFSNLSNFNRKFKQFTGLTPTQYIQKHKVALQI
ncbi:AraC family transcriptional regulator [Sediminitomix flava]|uniref:AraC family transcriptional regulator n=1 Tax=Sediminitomix flava TaxID=379075 RepID=A0A315ZF15_SEDFL|nr:AraC family transcriptional regulator [Sediminitomix flava]PWJ43749.1 AraC family transcriptional regulator [Sediminitomix flava]